MRTVMREEHKLWMPKASNPPRVECKTFDNPQREQELFPS
jgi:hypothetical protein